MQRGSSSTVGIDVSLVDRRMRTSLVEQGIGQKTFRISSLRLEALAATHAT